jgi:hypothetical protein
MMLPPQSEMVAGYGFLVEGALPMRHATLRWPALFLVASARIMAHSED